MSTLEHALDDLIEAVPQIDQSAVEQATARWDTLAKPPGSLGRIEVLGSQLAGISGTVPPPVPARPSLLVCAADHGVHASGVTPWPQAITTAMVEAMAGGQASCSAFARAVGAAVTVLDVGCAIPPRDGAGRAMGLRSMRVRAGTANLAEGPAMSREDAVRSILAGARAAREMLAAGTDLLCLGDMGLANTTASAALVAAMTGADPASVVGAGAGSPPDVVELKRAVITTALSRLDAAADPITVLAEVGGLEHGAIAGALLAGAAAGVPVVLDGVITDAAALIAVALRPQLRGFLLAGHLSTEPGAAVALAHLDLVPLLDLQLRLGEGTGALLAVPLIRAAAEALATTIPIADLTLPT